MITETGFGFPTKVIADGLQGRAVAIGQRIGRFAEGLHGEVREGIALEEAGGGGILPEATAVIFDEAHELEDVAGSYFGVTVSNLRFDDLARDVEHGLRQKNALSASLLQRSSCSRYSHRSPCCSV